MMREDVIGIVWLLVSEGGLGLLSDGEGYGDLSLKRDKVFERVVLGKREKMVSVIVCNDRDVCDGYVGRGLGDEE